MYLFRLAFAVLIMGFGLAILAKPKVILALTSHYSGSLVLYIAAILARLLVGVALLLYADQSKFPLVLTILGWLFIAGALSIAAIGRNRLKKFIEWAVNFMMPYARVTGILAVCLGGFIVYALV